GGRGAAERPEVTGAAGRDAGDLGRRVRPHAARGRPRRPRPPPRGVHGLAGRGRDQGRGGPRRDGRAGDARGRKRDDGARRARDYSAPIGPGPRAADLPLRRPRLPPNRRARARDPPDPGVTYLLAFRGRPKATAKREQEGVLSAEEADVEGEHRLTV